METKVIGDRSDLDAPVDIRQVLSPAHYERELRSIFRRAWLPVSRAYLLEKPGDYLVKELPTFGASVLLARGKDDRIRAFHNVCRHRGSKVVFDAGGHLPALSCPFHGWTYGLSGELLAIPDEDQFGALDKSRLGLVPIHCEEWEKLVFINMAEQPETSLAGWLGEFGGQYRNYFDRLWPLRSARVELDCNWHIAVNAFTESYHTVYLHRRTTPGIMGGDDNFMRHLPAVELAERHLRFANPANPGYRPTPAERLSFQFGTPMYPSFHSSPEAMPPGVNFARVEKWAFDVVHLFPNCIIVTGNGFCFELWVWPDGPERCVLESVILGAKAKTVGHRIAQEFNIMRSREVIAEDLASIEMQHKALASGAVSHINLSLQEIGVAHHYRTMRRMMGEGARA